MSLDSPADIIPFKRFLECRERLHGIAAANGTVVMPASTDLGIQPEVTGRANADHGESPRWIGTSTHEKATLTVRSVKMIAAKRP